MTWILWVMDLNLLWLRSITTSIIIQKQQRPGTQRPGWSSKILRSFGICFVTSETIRRQITHQLFENNWIFCWLWRICILFPFRISNYMICIIKLRCNPTAGQVLKNLCTWDTHHTATNATRQTPVERRWAVTTSDCAGKGSKGPKAWCPLNAKSSAFLWRLVLQSNSDNADIWFLPRKMLHAKWRPPLIRMVP